MSLINFGKYESRQYECKRPNNGQHKEPFHAMSILKSDQKQNNNRPDGMGRLVILSSLWMKLVSPVARLMFIGQEEM